MLLFSLLRQHFDQILVVVLYRVWLHPLRSFPGPPLAKVTDLYGGVLAFQKRLPVIIADLHEKNGSVVRVGPNRLLFNSPTAFQEIYRDDRNITKAWTYELITTNGVYSVFNTLDNDLHHAKRKVLAHAFSKRAIDMFEPNLIRQIDVFLDIVKRTSEEQLAVDMSTRMAFLAMDIVGLLSLGYDLGLQTSDENRLMTKAFSMSLWLDNIGHHFPFFSKLHKNKLFGILVRATRERFTVLIEKMVRSRMAVDTHARPDLFSFVADALPNRAVKTRDSAIWKEALVFIAGGGDTVASGMAGIFYYLSRNPECYEKVATEIRKKFPNASSIKNGIVLHSCDYLKACVEESLRMSPPISTNLWRQQVKGDDSHLVIDGHQIPKGTLFGVNIYALSHNPDIFPDPYTYKPERWLEDDPSLPAMKASFASFSIGPRDCVGKQLAYLEIMLVVAKTIWHFDFARAPGPLGMVGDAHDRGRPHEFAMKDGFNSMHEGPFLVFSSRS